MHEVLQRPVLFVAKRAPTIGNRVSPSLFLDRGNRGQSWLSTVGFHKCGHHICKVCNFANVTKTFQPTSHMITRPFAIKNDISCNSKNIMYLITCMDCCIQYVGCTTNTLKTRIRHHLSDISNEMAVRHFQIRTSGECSFILLLWHRESFL